LLFIIILKNRARCDGLYSNVISVVLTTLQFQCSPTSQVIKKVGSQIEGSYQKASHQGFDALTRVMFHTNIRCLARRSLPPNAFKSS